MALVNLVTTRRVLLGAAFVIFGLAPAAFFWQQTSLAERNQKNDSELADNVWQTAEKSAIANRAENLPDDFQTLRLYKQSLATLLSDAPHESRTPLRDSGLILQFPMPDGTFSRFRVQAAPVLEESLQAKFPEIKSYRAISIDDPGMTGRFDLSPRGFYATLIAPNKTVSILPADTSDETMYASYDGASLKMENDENFTCSISEKNQADTFKDEILALGLPTPTPVTAVPINQKLKTYKIVISTTFEYYDDQNLGGKSIPNTVASINTWMNGVNAVFERRGRNELSPQSHQAFDLSGDFKRGQNLSFVNGISEVQGNHDSFSRKSGRKYDKY